MEDQLSFLPPQKQTVDHVPRLTTTLQWIIYVDGASRGNPGPAGAGIHILCNDQDVLKKGIFLGTKTNNQAEYLALALALLYLHQERKKTTSSAADKLLVISDSELLIRQMQGNYAVKNSSLKSIKMVIDSELMHLHVTFKHMLREYNKVADKLANLGIDKKHPIPDEFKKMLLSRGVELS